MSISVANCIRVLVLTIPLVAFSIVWLAEAYGQQLFEKRCDNFDKLQARFANFHWQPVLSEPRDTDQWDGPTGFVHLTVRELLLARNQDFTACEFYICGPPQMLAATRNMIAEFGCPGHACSLMISVSSQKV